ncbi:protein PSY [Salix suchowensis]|nr:protein PSY [Salix suchowensis]
MAFGVRLCLCLLLVFAVISSARTPFHSQCVHAVGQLDSVDMAGSASIPVPASWLLSIYYLTNHSTFHYYMYADNEMASAIKGRSLKMTLSDYGDPMANSGHDPSHRDKNWGGRKG